VNELWQRLDRIPVTLVIAIAYVTLYVLTGVGKTGEESSKLLFEYGLLRPFEVADGQAWRLLASAFLHLGLAHVGLNTLALISIGPPVEMSLGSLRFLLLYVVAALGGDIAVCLTYPPNGGVLGGSGALFGLLGAILALNMRAGRHAFQFLEFEGPRRLVGMIAVYLVLPYFLPINISNAAHIGGLIAGFLVTFLWLRPGRAPTRALRQWRLAVTAMFATWTFWCLQPATRWDWLGLQSFTATGAQRDALRRAATMDYRGLPRATDAQTHWVDEFEQEVRGG